MPERDHSLLTCARGILEIAPQSLIPGYIPLGNVTVFEGDGGQGKSMMGIEIIASVSRGEKVFFDQSGAPPVMGGSASRDGGSGDYRGGHVGSPNYK
jgi:hypothetical protein